MHNEPLIRLAKRGALSSRRIWCIRLIAFLVALILGGLVFALAGANPISAYVQIVVSSLGKKSGLRQVVKISVPLLGTALALAPCFKMKYWNIGAEGQITMGAMACAYFAIHFGKTMNTVPLLIIMCISAAVMGGIWALIPAIFKARWNTNETLFTLMMNYIGIGIVAWLQGGPWEGKPGSQVVPNFESAAILPKLFGVHIGWIFVVILVFVMYVYMRYTKHGYEVAVLGDSENTARYAGMNVPKIIMRTAAFSGAICGVVGFMITSGANQTIYKDLAGGVGFTAITVAWLAQLNPFAMVAISVLLAVLEKGASSLQTAMNVPSSVSDIITGIILLCMLGCEFFINFRMIFRSKHHEKEAA